VVVIVQLWVEINTKKIIIKKYLVVVFWNVTFCISGKFGERERENNASGCMLKEDRDDTLLRNGSTYLSKYMASLPGREIFDTMLL